MPPSDRVPVTRSMSCATIVVVPTSTATPIIPDRGIALSNCRPYVFPRSARVAVTANRSRASTVPICVVIQTSLHNRIFGFTSQFAVNALHITDVVSQTRQGQIQKPLLRQGSNTYGCSRAQHDVSEAMRLFLLEFGTSSNRVSGGTSIRHRCEWWSGRPTHSPGEFRRVPAAQSVWS